MVKFGVAMVTGAVQPHTLKLSEKLQRRGVNVSLVCRRSPGLPEREGQNGVELYRVGATFGSRAMRSAAYVATAVRTLVELRDRFQVMHCHDLYSPLSAALLGKRLTGRALLLNPHAVGDVEQLKLQKVMGPSRLRGALKHADGFVAQTASVERELRGLGVEERRIFRVSNGVDTEAFRPATPADQVQLRKNLGLRPGAKLLVYSGPLIRGKGVDVLLDSWPEVRARLPNTELIIVGDGPELPALTAQAAALRIEGSVRFVGAQTNADEWLRAADAAVLPSRQEGLPLSLLEAMACALPVVATRVGGVSDAMDESMGRIVPAENRVQLADAIARALSSEQARAEGERGRIRVEARYALDAIADRYVQIYERITHEAARVGPVLGGAAT